MWGHACVARSFIAMFKKTSTSSAPFSAAPGFRRMKMNTFNNNWRRRWWWWLLCVVGSLHLDALKHKPSAPKGKRLGRHAFIGRVAQGQRGGGMRELGVFENWAGRCVLDLNYGSLDCDGTNRQTDKMAIGDRPPLYTR